MQELKWYAVTTYSGHEKKAKAMLQEKIRQLNAEEQFGEILIPTETVTKRQKDGKPVQKQKTSFPGYMFIEMNLTDYTRHLVRNTTKITGFVGNTAPKEIDPKNIKDLIGENASVPKKPKSNKKFEDGGEIRVISGPFNNFTGVIQEINYDKQKIKALVNIFGRQTSVELDFVNVEKKE